MGLVEFKIFFILLHVFEYIRCDLIVNSLGTQTILYNKSVDIY